MHGTQDAVEIFVTVILFAINVVVSVVTLREEFFPRLRHMGQELAFLALGIVCVHIHSVADVRTGLSLLATVLCYVLIWLVVFSISAHVLTDKGVWRNPLAYMTILFGMFTVYSALTDMILNATRRLL